MIKQQLSPRRGRGFTMLETLVSLFVIGLTASALIPSLVFSNQQIERGKHIDQATQVAASQVETYRRGGFDDLPDIPEGDASIQLPITDLGSLPGAKGVIKFIQVDDKLRPTPNETNRILIVTTVKWNATARDKGEVVLTTVVTPT